jgi:predicted aspartyl protease
LFFLSVLLFPSFVSFGQIQEQSPQEIPIKLLRNYVVVVQGSLGNVDRRSFLVDTGASPSILDRKIAHELQLVERAGSHLHLLGHNVDSSTAWIPSISVGPVGRQNVRVLVQDLSLLHARLGIRIDAILGLDVLSPENFTIDYRRKILRFGAVPHLASSLPFLGNSNSVSVEISSGRHPIRLLIDTGASGLILFQGSVPLGPQQYQPLTSSTNLGGDFAVRPVTLTDVELGDNRFSSLPASLVDAPDFARQGFDGLMGVSALDFRQIAFDFEHRIFSWELEDASANDHAQKSSHWWNRHPAAPSLSVLANQRDDNTR